MFRSADRVKETSIGTGTGAMTLAGAMFGHRTFSSVLAQGDTCYYVIQHATIDEWEIGIGTFQPGSLARTTVLSSTNSNSLVNFSAGTKEIFITASAEKFLQIDPSLSHYGNFTAGTITATLAGTATSSTQLATARNINGTSFNGSADITTANWGTSRNITIGSSTKAINGSNDVSWQLAEIGAQAVDADLDAIAALTGTSGLLRKTAANTWSLDTVAYLSGTVPVSSGGTGATTAANARSNLSAAESAQQAGAAYDFNNYIPSTPGLLRVVWNTGDAAMVNSPNGNSSGFLVASQGSHDKWNQQMFFEQGSTGSLWIRGQSDGGATRVWGTWNRVLTHLNYNNYTPTLGGSGATGTWGISITGNAGTVTNGVYISGDQQISGIKTFTTKVVINSGSDVDVLDLANNNIIGVNKLTFADPGPNEGLSWFGGNNWQVYEQPNDLTTNSAGNIQFVAGGVRKATINSTGQIEIPVSTGTAPLIVNSTTVVSNLNSDMLDGQHGSYYLNQTNHTNVPAMWARQFAFMGA